MQPSAKAKSTCPFSSIVTSLKSSRLRHGLLPPPFQIQALRCTGPFGVARAVVQFAPPSYVCATQPYHVPLKSTSWGFPEVFVPRKTTAARSGSPATADTKAALLIPQLAPISKDLVQ